MAMMSIRSIVCLLGFLLLLGCGDNAKDLFETAAFEDSQNNVAHAKEIYQEIVTKFPTSKEAEIARVRLESLKDQ